MLVKNWMTRDVITITPEHSMQDAIYLMQEHQVALLPVLKNGKLAGVISDRDLKRASPSDATSLDVHEMLYLISKVRIKDLMKRKVVTIPEDYTVEEAAQVLLENRISGAPVVDAKGGLTGIITRSDIFKVLISITGLGKKGLQIALRVPDKPGPIKALKEIISDFGARTASILSSTDGAPEGYYNVYLRIYQVDRATLPALIEKVKTVGELLYYVDHREDARTVCEGC